MTIRVGNASAPRWYDLSMDGLRRFIGYVQSQGATSTELVLHAGPADDHTRRVHVLQEDWFPVFEQYRSAGMRVHAHAPLSPRFKLDRWTSEREALKAEFEPILTAVAAFAEQQGQRCVFVVHAASGASRGAIDATAGFLEWAVGSPALTDAGIDFAVELRKPHDADDRRLDRRRDTLAGFIARMDHPRIGIAWDLGHDWEASHTDPEWRSEIDRAFLQRVSHVHVHGSSGDDRAVHFPLQAGGVPWADMLRPLIRAGYDGAVTMEVRYRYAVAMGEPWNVLGESYALMRSFLATTTSE